MGLVPDTEALLTVISNRAVSEFALEYSVFAINTSSAMGLDYLLKDSGLL